MNVGNDVFSVQVAFFFSQDTDISIIKMAGEIQESGWGSIELWNSKNGFSNRH